MNQQSDDKALQAKFIVRREDYPTLRYYPRRCATIVGEIEANPDNLRDPTELIVSIADQLREHKAELRDAGAYEYKAYGEFRHHKSRADSSIRNPANMDTFASEGHRSHHAVQRRAGEKRSFVDKLLGRKKILDETLTYTFKEGCNKSRNPELRMSRLSYHTQYPKSDVINRIVHTESRSIDELGKSGANVSDDYFDLGKKENIIYESERRWSAMSQAYFRALNGHEAALQRDAAIEFYRLLSHDMPLVSGSATLARIALQCLADHIGMEIMPNRKGIDLNTQALTTPLELFQKRWRDEDYFDHEAVPEKIIRWHERECNRPPIQL